MRFIRQTARWLSAHLTDRYGEPPSNPHHGLCGSSRAPESERQPQVFAGIWGKCFRGWSWEQCGARELYFPRSVAPVFAWPCWFGQELANKMRKLPFMRNVAFLFPVQDFYNLFKGLINDIDNGYIPFPFPVPGPYYCFCWHTGVASWVTWMVDGPSLMLLVTPALFLLD